MDPPTWRPGNGVGQGRVCGGTPRSDGEVRVGCAKDVVHALNCETPFCLYSRCVWCSEHLAVTLPRRAHASMLSFSHS